MPTPKQIDRQNRMLTAALREFSNEGYHAANVENIAKEAGVGKATIYRHYSNKEGLFLGVFDHILQRLERSIRERADFADFAKGTREAIRTYFEQLSENPDIFMFFRLFTHDSHVPDTQLRQQLADRYMNAALWAVSEIRTAQKRGQVNTKLDPERMIYATLGMMQFLMYHWLRHRQPKNIYDNVDLVCEMIFNGVGGKNARRGK